MLLAAPRLTAPFGARSMLVTDAAGKDRVLTVVKAAWTVPVGSAPSVALAANEVRPVPVLHEERAGSSIRLPSDLAAVKPGTEILLVGHARHPAAYADARWVDVTLAIEGDKPLLQKSLRVFGPRQWHERNGAMVPGDPAPYRETPLRWEWAFGGSGEARNPIGRGASALRGHRPDQECHRIEGVDPADESSTLSFEPAGFGPIAAHWEPRRSRAGSMTPADLAPHPPVDRDPRHYCSASDDQWLPEPLRGGESFVITGVHAHRAWRFALPTVQPEIGWSIRGRFERATPHLDTVILDADAQLVTACWRVSFMAPRNLDDLGAITVGSQSARVERGVESRQLPHPEPVA